MKKRLLALLSTVAVILCFSSMFSACFERTVIYSDKAKESEVAEDVSDNNGTRGLKYILNEDKESYTCTGLGTASGTAITIASQCNGKPVTAVGKSAFSSCYKLTSITIAESVTTIGDYAFQNCTGILSIKIPDKVTSIGEWAFGRCSLIESVIIPDNVKSVGDGAFAYCTFLESVTVGSGVEYIGLDAFIGCSSLSGINFKDNEGWKVSRYSDMSQAENIDVADPAVNAGNLKNDYCEFYWQR